MELLGLINVLLVINNYRLFVDTYVVPYYVSNNVAVLPYYYGFIFRDKMSVLLRTIIVIGSIHERK